MTLTVQSLDLELPPGILGKIRAVLAEDHVTGMVFVGPVSGSAELVYLLWHRAHEMTVSITVPRSALATAEGAQRVARVFLERWKQRPR